MWDSRTKAINLRLNLRNESEWEGGGKGELTQRDHCRHRCLCASVEMGLLKSQHLRMASFCGWPGPKNVPLHSHSSWLFPRTSELLHWHSPYPPKFSESCTSPSGLLPCKRDSLPWVSSLGPLAVLNLEWRAVDSDPGKDHIYSDVFLSSWLDLSSGNRLFCFWGRFLLWVKLISAPKIQSDVHVHTLSLILTLTYSKRYVASTIKGLLCAGTAHPSNFSHFPLNLCFQSEEDH